MVRFAAFAVTGILILLLMFHWWYSLPNDQVRFDSKHWRGEIDSDTDRIPRRTMIRDLVTNVLPGLSRTEIESLLGTSVTPDEYPHFMDFDWDMTYVIGKPASMSELQQLFWPLLGGEYEYEEFFIRIGENGKFKSWFVEDFNQKNWEYVVGSPGTRTLHEFK